MDRSVLIFFAVVMFLMGCLFLLVLFFVVSVLYVCSISFLGDICVTNLGLLIFSINNGNLE